MSAGNIGNMAEHLSQPGLDKSHGICIAPELVNCMLSGLEGRNIDVDAYLRRVGIEPAALRTPNWPGITQMQYAALFYSLRADLEDEILGLLSRPLKLGSFALMARTGLSAPDLREALRRVSKVANLLQDDIIVTLQVNDGEAGLHMVPADPSRTMPVATEQIFIRVLWRLMAWLVDASLRIRHFDFTFPEAAHQDAMSVAFPAPRRFERKAFGFWFPASALQMPIRQNASTLRVFLGDAHTHISLPPRRFEIYEHKVRNLLTSSYPAWPSLNQIAEILRTSPATLQRHLKAEGTSFQEIKNEMRRDLAIAWLLSSGDSLVHIAGELGFSDSATFQRAFKQWTGHSCGEYRQKQPLFAAQRTA